MLLLPAGSCPLGSPACGHCGRGKEGLLQCECRLVWYCDRRCQEQHQSSHLQKCKLCREVQSQKLSLASDMARREAIKRPAGLRNLGNTCYMNSGLQVLFYLRELGQYFLRTEFVDHINIVNPLGMSTPLTRWRDGHRLRPAPARRG